MTPAAVITTLFLDVGGVLLSDGWDRYARERAAVTFELDPAEFEARHHLLFETYEEGKLTLEDYLSLAVFHQERSFTRQQFRDFMFLQSTPHADMLALVQRLKARHGLKIVTVSNEGRELNAHRVSAFGLAGFVDAFISSSFVQIRKPDPGIFRLALDVAQARAEQVLYLENTPLFVEIARGLGISGLVHTDYESTRTQLAARGLADDEEAGHGAG